MYKAIVLDRDGTIIKDFGYMHDHKQIQLLPHAIEGLRLFQEWGFNLIIATNQSGIGRGMFSELQYLNFNNQLLRLLSKEGVNIKAVKYCPHSPSDNCNCRKPKIGMLGEIVKSLDLNSSYAIGDKNSDIQFGKNLGIRSILISEEIVRSGNNQVSNADYVAPNLLDAARWVKLNDNRT